MEAIIAMGLDVVNHDEVISEDFCLYTHYFIAALKMSAHELFGLLEKKIKITRDAACQRRCTAEIKIFFYFILAGRNIVFWIRVGSAS